MTPKTQYKVIGYMSPEGKPAGGAIYAVSSTNLIALGRHRHPRSTTEMRNEASK